LQRPGRRQARPRQASAPALPAQRAAQHPADDRHLKPTVPARVRPAWSVSIALRTPAWTGLQRAVELHHAVHSCRNAATATITRLPFVLVALPFGRPRSATGTAGFVA